ncbi:MAG: transcription elongation factor GreA [Planctomycetota bacterium]|nr:transcription elongation factor GreA [Planctomycetota bacterium]
MSERVPMTQEKYDELAAEIEHMESVELIAITEKVAEAREEGDLKENAEYHGQRELQGMLQARINQKKEVLSNAVIIDPSKINQDEVGFGACVKVIDTDIDMEEEITLVGKGDEDYDKGKYLLTSPIGKGLVGKKVGDEVEIPIPKGTLNFKILEINYDI